MSQINGTAIPWAGGAGNDVLALFASAYGEQAGPGGDVIDIADLLDADTNFADGAGGSLSHYVPIVAYGSDGLLQIDADGTGGGGWVTLAIITNGQALMLGQLQADGNVVV